MEPLDFTRCRALNNIPSKKLQEELDAINAGPDPIEVKHVKLIAINRYAESNIPIEYWKLKMERDFVGDSRLKQKYNEYIADLRISHQSGSSFCLAGGHGVGKTMTMTCILKKASQKGYSCLYTTLSDIVSVLIQAPPEDRFLARQELIKVDFLVIDEFDSRFMASDNAADLYARTLESIFRTRSANKQPTLMCTNSPNVVESFHGSLKASVGSLMKGYTKIFAVLGEDVRGKWQEEISALMTNIMKIDARFQAAYDDFRQFKDGLSKNDLRTVLIHGKRIVTDLECEKQNNALSVSDEKIAKLVADFVNKYEAR